MATYYYRLGLLNTGIRKNHRLLRYAISAKSSRTLVHSGFAEMPSLAPDVFSSPLELLHSLRKFQIWINRLIVKSPIAI